MNGFPFREGHVVARAEIPAETALSVLGSVTAPHFNNLSPLCLDHLQTVQINDLKSRHGDLPTKALSCQS